MKSPEGNLWLLDDGSLLMQPPNLQAFVEENPLAVSLIKARNVFIINVKCVNTFAIK